MVREPGFRGVFAMVLGLVLSVCASAAAQERPEWARDPYTKGDPDALARAGYVRLDGLAWGDDHDTRDIEDVLGRVPVAWIETAHFRLGCALPEHPVQLEEKDALRAELTALKKRVPGVKDRTKVLDRWLLAHLYAQRLEALYAEVQDLFGVSDADFLEPEVVPSGGAATEGAAGGDGASGTGGPGGEDDGAAAERSGEPPPPAPYLGQRDKYCVLLLGSSSALGRYAARWGLGGDPAPQALNFHRRGSLAFVTSSEFFRGAFTQDAALHTHVVWQVALNLLRGYRGFTHETSFWIRTGFAHLLARRVDPRFVPLPRVRETAGETFAKSDWAPSVRALVGHGVYPTLDELWTFTDAQDRSFAEHRAMWSRIDHLSRDREAFAQFVRLCKEPFVSETGGVPTPDEVAQRERAALLTAYGWTPAECDAAWVEWVGKRYPRK